MKRKNKLILEFTQFDAERMNTQNSTLSVAVEDPSLSVDGHNRHLNRMSAAFSRINNILKSVATSGAYSNFKRDLLTEEQDIKSIKILRIIKSGIQYNLYFSLVISDKEYWGVIEDVLGTSNIDCECFKDPELYLGKEWIIKTKGIIKKVMINFLTKIEKGKWKLLNDEAYCYNPVDGKILILERGMEVEVISVHDNKITIEYKTNIYELRGNSFIYFNWWFEKI